MCGNMVDIQFGTAGIWRGKKKGEERKNKLQDKNIMSASAIRRAAIKTKSISVSECGPMPNVMAALRI